MKKLCYFALAALAFTACSDDDDKAPKLFPGQVISFEASEHLLDAMTGEDVALGEVMINLYGIGDYTFNKVFCAEPYAPKETPFDGMLFSTADNNVVFNSYYSNTYDTGAWGGIALAQMGDMALVGASLKQQFSVWAPGGANGTDTYAVFYDSNSPTEMYPDYLTESGYPTIDLMEPRIVDHLYIANSTYVFNFYKGNDGDNFQVKITGSLAGVETGTVTETLVSGRSKLNGWRKVDLSSLGTVDKVVFKVICNYLTDPTYFCVDEIGLLKPEA